MRESTDPTFAHVQGERTIAAGSMIVGTLNMADPRDVRRATSRVGTLGVSSIGLAALSVAIGPPLLAALPRETAAGVAVALVISTTMLAGWSGYIFLLKRRIERHLAALAAADGANALALVAERWITQTSRVSVRQILQSIGLTSTWGGGISTVIVGGSIWVLPMHPQAQIAPDYEFADAGRDSSDLAASEASNIAVETTREAPESAMTAEITTQWHHVWTAWDGLRQRFPFASPSSGTASFEDFHAFFRPDGILWTFVASHFSEQRLPADGAYVSRAAPRPPPELVSCLSVAKEVTAAFFSSDGSEGLRFSVKADWAATDLSEARLSVGDKATVLVRAQWSPSLKWNGERTRLEWIQGGRATTEIGRGSFSLFDLLGQFGGVRPSTGERMVYVVDYPPFSLKIRATGEGDPFRSDFFTRLRCPRTL